MIRKLKGKRVETMDTLYANARHRTRQELRKELIAKAERKRMERERLKVHLPLLNTSDRLELIILREIIGYLTDGDD